LVSLAEWPVVRLEQLAAPTRNALVGGPFGSDLVSADYVPAGVPVVRGENLSGRRWVGGDFVCVSAAKAERLAANTTGPLDIVFTQRGANHYRQVAVVPPGSPRMLISQSQMKVTVDTLLADPLFVYYAFRTPVIQDWLQRHAIQTGVPHTNLGILRAAPVPLPSLGEQRRVVRILGTLDDKIELNRRTNETLESIVRTLFKSWFVDFGPVRAKSEGRDPGLPSHLANLFPDTFKDSELGEIPKGWRVQPFSDTIEIIGGGTPKTSVAEYWNGEIPWFSVVDAPTGSDVWVMNTEKTITSEGVEKSSTRVLPVGTTIISARGTVGRVALVGVPMAMNQSCYGVLGKAGAHGFFTYFAVRELVASLQQHAHGSVFDTITRDTLAGVSVARPPTALIEGFEEAVCAMMERLRTDLVQSTTLATARDSLLPKLISGELRPKDVGRIMEAVSA
jgi:restriction endonuclease S subunit